ncbi:SAYSvFN domain-containing protein 1 isoform X1 [Bactrocera dorsalis]|uniref:SAYSvFN domain-containing protein 1 isoform X1 n=2 Tax=Bactrocera dorsalis TaxID=27457 RepID=A0ABM3JAJ5_BACDO|nr:SAYSvFN domain-containing protein 1 isoform X1 [Bactrocera dorsalis]
MAEELRNKLYKYRFKKQRQKVIQIFKSKLIEFWMLGMGEPSLSEGEQVGINVVEKDVDLNKFQNQDSNAKFTKNVEYELAQNSDDEDERESVSEVKSSSDLYRYALSVVILLFWITVYFIAIKLQFGTVYLMISALIGIYLNTRTTPKNTNEISAYSVFNKNCKSIDGTLKAEQFELEIRCGSLRKN